MHSFDVFNTLIARMTATPYGIFAIMRERLLTQNADINSDCRIPLRISADFCVFRIQAENLARYHNQMRGVEEVTLNEIYEAMSMAEELSEGVKNYLIQLEIETEYANVLPLAKNISRLKELIDHGEHVVLVSDMYLSGETIKNMLVKADDVFDHIPVYVSSDLTARKTTGNLYRRVKEIEGVEYADWTHYGDDQFQDIQVAENLGIHTLYLEAQPFMTQEKRFLKLFPYNTTLHFLVGQARYTRYKDSIDKTPGRVGSSLCGPLIYSYVDWVLRKCEEKGIKRLYFIARDGYFPKIVADRLIKGRGLEIETHYIYGSRKAWRVCSLRNEHFNLFELIAWSYANRIDTTEKLAGILELSVEELAPFLPFGSREAGAYLSTQGRYEIAKRLDGDLDFKSFYLERLKGKRDLAVRYIRQQVDIKDDKFAFVDVAGGGFTQGCLKQLMADFYDNPIETFFFKADRVNQAEGCIYHVFFPSRLPNDLIMEMMFRAPHGQTVGYKQNGDKVEPVLESFENRALIEHGFEKLTAGIIGFTEQMIEAERANGLLPGSMEIIEAYFRYVSSRPDKEILEYIATFPNNETGQKEHATEYAPKLAREDILNIFIRRMYWEHVSEYYKGTNLDYSLLRCNKEERELVKKCQKEYDSEWGLKERREKITADQNLIQKYGRAAFYPCELLEEKIVLYGAGKFGKRLYSRIREQGKSNIVKWVDKRAERDEGFETNVEPVSSIENVDFDQVVIAVIDKKMAEEIREELEQRGIQKKKILWIQTYWYRNPAMVWE